MDALQRGERQQRQQKLEAEERAVERLLADVETGIATRISAPGSSSVDQLKLGEQVRRELERIQGSDPDFGRREVAARAQRRLDERAHLVRRAPGARW